MKQKLFLLPVMLIAFGMLFTACKDEEEEITYIVTVNSNDASMGTVTRTPDSAVYHAGTQVTITATPNAGYHFVGWTGTTNTESSFVMTVTGNATITANFEADPVPQDPTWSASFDGSPLDIAGYADFQTNGTLWLVQFASNAEGTSVYFPYIVMWFEGTSASDFMVYSSRAIELYKDTYYTSGSDQYGDWQYWATVSMDVTAIDLTEYNLSMTGTYTMYDLGEIVNGTYDNPADCTKKDLTVSGENWHFTFVSKDKAAMAKKRVK